MRENICKNEKLCTGCTACVNVCPTKCISMHPDKEGFLYPSIDHTKCIDCYKCECTCPVNNEVQKNEVIQGKVMRYKKLDVVMDSTSGGSCSSFTDYTFKRNGSIFGVVYDDKLKVCHVEANNTQPELATKMRGSKYVQSYLADSFTRIKNLLEQDTFVCFVGTPCQVDGLTAFLGEKKEYDNLLTVDLVCHGVSSPLYFEKYVEYLKRKHYSTPVDIRFRNKTYGYHSGTMRVDFENGKKYYGSGRIDRMLKAYFAGACSRYSCYECPFKGEQRCSDYTIFDSWNIDKLVSGQSDDDKGYTNIFIHTKKGMKLFDDIFGDCESWTANYQLMKKLDGVMIDNNPKMHPSRKVLIEDVLCRGFEKTNQKYLPITSKDYAIEFIKASLYKIGLLKIIEK